MTPSRMADDLARAAEGLGGAGDEADYDDARDPPRPDAGPGGPSTDLPSR